MSQVVNNDDHNEEEEEEDDDNDEDDAADDKVVNNDDHNEEDEEEEEDDEEDYEAADDDDGKQVPLSTMSHTVTYFKRHFDELFYTYKVLYRSSVERKAGAAQPTISKYFCLK